MIRILFYINLLSFILPILSNAGIIPINSTTETRLGFGINVATEQNFNKCIEEFNTADLIPEDYFSHDHNAPVTVRDLKIKTEIIRSRQTLDEYRNTSISAKANYMAYSGSASYNLEERDKVSSDQIIVGIRAHADLGRYYIKSPKLKNDYKKLSDTNLNEFYKQCGHEFVSGFIRSQGVSIILRSLNTVNETYKKMEAKIKTGVNAGNASGSIEGTFLNVANSLVQYGALSIEIYAYGVGGLQSFTKLISSENEVKLFLNSVSTILNASNFDNAGKSNYITSTYPIKNQPYNSEETKFQKQSMQDLAYAIEKANNDYRSLKNAVLTDLNKDYSNLCKVNYKITCSDYNQYLKAKLINRETIVGTLLGSLNRCATIGTFDACKLSTVIDHINEAQSDNINWPHQYLQILKNLEYENKIKEFIKYQAEN